MNKKVVLVAAVATTLVVGYAALSWSLGRSIHSRFDAWEQELIKQPLPFLAIVDRKYTPGIFSSVEEVTFGLDPDFLRSMGPPVPSEDEEPDADEDAEDADDEPTLQPAAWHPVADLATEAGGFSITLRNDIRHGPFPGLSSLGLGEIVTRFVMSDATRQEIDKVFAGRDPVLLTTRLGLQGDLTAHLSSPPTTLDNDMGKGSWKGVEGTLFLNRDGSAMKCDFIAPGLEVETTDKGKASIDPITMTCDFRRAFDVLYVGKFDVAIAGMRGTSKGQPASFEKVGYGFDLTADGDYVDVAVRLGMGAVAAEGVTVNDLGFAFTVKHLHGPTLAAYVKKVDSLAVANPTGTAAFDQAFEEFAPVLLEHSPELAIDRIGFALPEGDWGIKGTVRLAGFKKDDMATPEARAALVGKVEVTGDIWADEALLNRDWSSFPVGSETRTGDDELLTENPRPPGPSAEERTAALRKQVATFEEQGYITRKDDQLSTHVEFKGGALTANGKPVTPPGAKQPPSGQ